MNKYIIKNCECKVKGKTTLCVKDMPYKKCENITGCVLKQIVELCKPLNTKQPESYYNLEILLAKRILELLDIQEVE